MYEVCPVSGVENVDEPMELCFEISSWSVHVWFKTDVYINVDYKLRV